MLASCWPTVYDAGPAINQHWGKVSFPGVALSSAIVYDTQVNLRYMTYQTIV